MRPAAVYPIALARLWIDRLRNAHTHHHAIARGMAWVMFFVLLGSAARAAREMAIAYRYGVSADVDAYLFVFNLVSWPIAVWFSVLSIVLVPLASDFKEHESAGLSLFRAELLGLTLLFGMSLAIVSWTGLPLLLRSSLAALPANTAEIAINMIPMLTLLLPIGLIISLFSAWMLVAARHINTLLEGVPALVLVMALLLYPSSGWEPLVWGTIGGFVCHLTVLAVPLWKRDEIASPLFTQASSQWPIFWRGFTLMLVGQALMSLTNVIDQFFAARIGTGALATLTYANRVLMVILGLGATAVSRSTLPVFAQAEARKGVDTRRIAVHWARFMFVVGAAAVAAGWFVAPWAIQLFFEHGQFTAQDTESVSEVLRYGLLQVPFYFSGLIFVSFLSSMGQYVWILWSGVIGISLKFLGNILLVPAYGVKGITLSTALIYASNVLFFYWITKKITRTG